MNKHDTSIDMSRSDQTGISSLSKELQSSLLYSVLLYSPDGMAFLDEALVIRVANVPFAEQLRIPLDQLVGRSIEDVLPGWFAELSSIHEEIRRTGRPFHTGACPFKLRDQPDRGITYWEFVVSPVYGNDKTFLGYMVHGREVTDREKAEAERSRLMADLQRSNEQLVLTSGQLQKRIEEANATTARLQAIQSITESALLHLQLDDLLAELLRRIRRLLASDVAMILLLSPDGRYLEVRAAEGLEREIRQHVRVPIGQGIAGRIAASRRPTIVDDLSTVEVVSPVLREKIKSLAGVPLLVEERVIGVLYLGTTRTRRYAKSDLQLLELVADRAALAIDRTKLFEAEQNERLAAEQAADRVERLLEVTTSLVEAVSPAQVAEAVISRSVTAMDAVAGLIILLSEDKATLTVVAAHGYPEGALKQLGPVPLDAPIPMAEVIRTGQPIFLKSSTERDQLYPYLPMIAPASQRQSFAAIPLTIEGRPAGAIGLGFAKARDFTKVDRNFLNSLARQASIALERARLYDAEKRARAEAEAAVRARDMFLSVASHELKTPITSLLGFAQVTIRHLEREEKPDLQRIRRALHVIQEQSKRLNRLVFQLLDISRLESGRLQLERKVVDVVELVPEAVNTIKAAFPWADIVIHAPSKAMALVDPDRLEQVLINLLNNAVKFSPHDAQIEITVALRSPQILELAVRDYGIGIPTDRRQGIFKPFYQAHGPGQAGGMGLGLHISKQIANLHGGDIEAEFPPDGGTRFVVTLPTGLPEVKTTSKPEKARA